jgi:tetratricopeptide (TPR) repeat protein
MKRILVAIAAIGFASTLQSVYGENVLVSNGKPRAEIVIASDPPRTTRLAARELQTYVEKISGAKLSIVNEPTGNFPVSVFVGQSAQTEKLGMTTEGLTNGAWRIVSGDGWLVLIGDDSDFTPTEPWPRNNNDIASGRMQKAWDRITGKHWGYTHSQLHKHYSGPNSLFGTPNEQKTDKDGNVHVWTYDERGSFNAVCGFLRSLGVRWYMPGEIGEVVPKADSIVVPEIDRTVHPDFPMRILNFRAAVYGRDAMMWGFRLGVRQPFGRQAAHGLDRMTDNEQTLANHPDWFALYGGKRHTQPGLRLHQLCYSNDELFREAVAFARAQFDHYDMDVVSIMPPDGYTAICQCEKCEGKESPELGYRGSLSNYVWDFVNRVAREVRKTHPDKKISNCAYGVYTAPPGNIDKLEPNVQVIIVGGRRPTHADRSELHELRAAWAEKTDNPVEIFENYPFTGRGFYLPAFIPNVLGESINATKGQSRGEDIWLTMDFGENAIGYNHFLIYFTSVMYWGGNDQDVASLFDEYCRLFYGPAAGEMRSFFRYCEEHWREMELDGPKAERALALFAAAKSKAPRESVYEKRIQLIDNFLNGLRNKSVQLAQKRGPVPKLRLVSGSRGKIVIDGKLDDEPWEKIPVASTGGLRELQTGRLPIYGTSIKTEWIGNNLYFAIQCQDHAGTKPNVTATKNGDQAIWYGDAVEVLLGTDSHSYYQIVVNPAGAFIDLDRGASRNNWFNWSSQAEIATHIADDHWTAEIRIPVTQDDNDPLHQVVGRRPTRSLPWHINVCRQRIRENGSEYSAFSPTGTAGFHEPMKFGHFYAGLSHQFPADKSVSDFVLSRRAAEEQLRARRLREAMASYEALASVEKTTEMQRSDALEQAASCARSLNDFSRAETLAGQIPIEAVAMTCQMETLLAQRKYSALIEQFGKEDLNRWPFWQIGPGAFARGKAFAALTNGPRAEVDFQSALVFTSGPRRRTAILTQLGHNRELNLKDDAGALKAYRLNFETRSSIGGAEEFRSVHNAARILTRQRKFDEAIAALGHAKVDALRGFWRHSTLLVLGETLSAAGRTEKAATTFRRVLADESASASHRKTAEQHLQKLDAK